MLENIEILNSQNPLIPESPKVETFKDTICLPPTEGDYIHIEATSERLADSFGRFAEQFGIPPDEARSFFTNRVDFQFGTADDLPLFDTKLDNAWARLITFLQPGRGLGITGPERDGKYIVRIDVQNIARALPHLNTKEFKVKDYDQMTKEERIASFEQSVETVTEHEFFHVLQEMENPEAMQEASKRMQDSLRLFLTFVVSTTAMNLIPQLRSAIIPLSIPILGLIVYLNRNAIIQVEPDAYEAQKYALGLDLRSPFNFVHETTPK